MLSVAYLILLLPFVLVAFHEKKQAVRDQEQLAEAVNSLSEGVKEFGETARSFEIKVAGFPSKQSLSEKAGEILVGVESSLYELVSHAKEQNLRDEALGKIPRVVPAALVTRVDWSLRLSVRKSRLRREKEWSPETEGNDVCLELAKSY